MRLATAAILALVPLWSPTAASALAWQSPPTISANTSEASEKPTRATLNAAIARSLAEGNAPEPLLMRSDVAATLVLESAGKSGPRAGHARLLAWLGEAGSAADIDRWLEQRRVDRYTAVQALVALDSPKALDRAIELFHDDAVFGGPLV